MQPEPSNTRLSEQQLDMLRLFKTHMPEEAYKEIRRFIVQSLAKQLDTEVEKWVEEAGITEEHYEKLTQQQFRSSKRSTE